MTTIRRNPSVRIPRENCNFSTSDEQRRLINDTMLLSREHQKLLHNDGDRDRDSIIDEPTSSFSVTTVQHSLSTLPCTLHCDIFGLVYEHFQRCTLADKLTIFQYVDKYIPIHHVLYMLLRELLITKNQKITSTIIPRTASHKSTTTVRGLSKSSTRSTTMHYPHFVYRTTIRVDDGLDETVDTIATLPFSVVLSGQPSDNNNNNLPLIVDNASANVVNHSTIHDTLRSRLNNAKQHYRNHAGTTEIDHNDRTTVMIDDTIADNVTTDDDDYDDDYEEIEENNEWRKKSKYKSTRGKHPSSSQVPPKIIIVRTVRNYSSTLDNLAPGMSSVLVQHSTSAFTTTSTNTISIINSPPLIVDPQYQRHHNRKLQRDQRRNNYLQQKPHTSSSASYPHQQRQQSQQQQQQHNYQQYNNKCDNKYNNSNNLDDDFGEFLYSDDSSSIDDIDDENDTNVTDNRTMLAVMNNEGLRKPDKNHFPTFPSTTSTPPVVPPLLVNNTDSSSSSGIDNIVHNGRRTPYIDHCDMRKNGDAPSPLRLPTTSTERYSEERKKRVRALSQPAVSISATSTPTSKKTTKRKHPTDTTTTPTTIAGSIMDRGNTMSTATETETKRRHLSAARITHKLFSKSSQSIRNRYRENRELLTNCYELCESNSVYDDDSAQQVFQHLTMDLTLSNVTVVRPSLTNQSSLATHVYCMNEGQTKVISTLRPIDWHDERTFLRSITHSWNFDERIIVEIWKPEITNLRDNHYQQQQSQWQQQKQDYTQFHVIRTNTEHDNRENNMDYSIEDEDEETSSKSINTRRFLTLYHDTVNLCTILNEIRTNVDQLLLRVGNIVEMKTATMRTTTTATTATTSITPKKLTTLANTSPNQNYGNPNARHTTMRNPATTNDEYDKCDTILEQRRPTISILLREQNLERERDITRTIQLQKLNATTVQAVRTNDMRSMYEREFSLTSFHTLVVHCVQLAHAKTFSLYDMILFTEFDAWRVFNDTLDYALRIFAKKHFYPVGQALWDIILVRKDPSAVAATHYTTDCNQATTATTSTTAVTQLMMMQQQNEANTSIYATYDIAWLHDPAINAGDFITFVQTFRQFLRMCVNTCCCYFLNKKVLNTRKGSNKHICSMPKATQGTYYALFLRMSLGHELLCTSQINCTRDALIWMQKYRTLNEHLWRKRRIHRSTLLPLHLDDVSKRFQREQHQHRNWITDYYSRSPSSYNLMGDNIDDNDNDDNYNNHTNNNHNDNNNDNNVDVDNDEDDQHNVVPIMLPSCTNDPNTNSSSTHFRTTIADDNSVDDDYTLTEYNFDETF